MTSKQDTGPVLIFYLCLVSIVKWILQANAFKMDQGKKTIENGKQIESRLLLLTVSLSLNLMTLRHIAFKSKWLLNPDWFVKTLFVFSIIMSETRANVNRNHSSANNINCFCPPALSFYWQFSVISHPTANLHRTDLWTATLASYQSVISSKCLLTELNYLLSVSTINDKDTAIKVTVELLHPSKLR